MAISNHTPPTAPLRNPSGLLRPMRLLLLAGLSFGLSAPFPATADFQPATPPEVARQPLLVGIKTAPPFVIKHPDGSFSGVSIELWREIADRLHLTYDFEETTLSGLLDGLREGRYDAGVAALTPTPERVRGMDFSHPFYGSGLGVAISSEAGSSWGAMIAGLLSWQLLRAVLGLAALLLLFGVLIWWVERHRNPQFSGPPIPGIGDGFWWSAVTMTTVGYGDRTPVTRPGRGIALVWMFLSVIIISSATGAIASAFTVSRLNAVVRDLSDLPKVRVGGVAGTTGERFLRSARIEVRDHPTAQAALQALANRRIDAVVHDEAILRYLVKQGFRDQVQVLPQTVRKQDYAIGLPYGSRLRKPINAALLSIVREDSWGDTLYDYLGP